MPSSRKTSTQGSGEAARLTVGVVGLGLMGTSIATCLVAAGHPVVGVEPDPSKRSLARRRILAYLTQMKALHEVQLRDPRPR